MSRPKPFIHFKSSISSTSVRALKSSKSPLGRSAVVSLSSGSRLSAFTVASRSGKNGTQSQSARQSLRGTSPNVRQSLRGTSPNVRQSLRDKSQQQQEPQPPAFQQQNQQQSTQESPPAPSAPKGQVDGTMVKMTASASRMSFADDSARHANASMPTGTGDPNSAEHLSRVVAQARTTAAISIRRTQSAKSKRSVSRGSSASGAAHSVKKKGKLLEFGPLRFMAAKEPSSNNNKGKVKLVMRQDSQRPGLRAMLYGLTLKMEREEKLQKKQLRKRAGELFMRFWNLLCDFFNV